MDQDTTTQPSESTLPARQVYAPDVKLAAVRAFIDEGLTRREVVKLYNIASTSTLKKWVIAYKREGESALQVKTKGRPRGSNKVAQLERSELEAVRFEVSRLSKKLAVRE